MPSAFAQVFANDKDARNRPLGRSVPPTRGVPPTDGARSALQISALLASSAPRVHAQCAQKVTALRFARSALRATSERSALRSKRTALSSEAHCASIHRAVRASPKRSARLHRRSARSRRRTAALWSRTSPLRRPLAPPVAIWHLNAVSGHQHVLRHSRPANQQTRPPRPAHFVC